MEPQQFFIKGRTVGADDPQLQQLLAIVHNTPERPRCLCVKGGIDMYVARAGSYQIKRMPGSGKHHHPSCDAFEPDYGESGLGMLMGEAVIEREGAEVELRLGFQLALKSKRPAQACSGELTPAAQVKTAKYRMSMRSLLHFLLERAGMNRWYPGMAGKRSQYFFHKHLTEVAQDITIQNIRLAERLLVPEAFNEARQADIVERRRAKLTKLYGAQPGGEQKLALIVGEFKSCEQTYGGRRIWVKHMPEMPLFIEDKTWARMERLYGPLLSARDAVGADGNVRLRILLCALVYAKRELTFQIDSACMLLATSNWIPIEGIHEVALIETLTEQGRKFVKPLRYDAPNAARFANALLLDTGEEPIPLHVLSPFMERKERSLKEGVIVDHSGAWIWDTSGDMPSLPAIAHSGRQP